MISGFSTTVKICSNIPYVVIDYQTRVLRRDGALSYIDELLDKGYSEEYISNKMRDKSVMAVYGNWRLY